MIAKVGSFFSYGLEKLYDFAALAFIIREHLRQLLFVIACDAVRQHMNGIAAFRHIEAGGFDAGRGVRTGDIKVVKAMLPDKGGERLTGQCIAF